MMLWVENVALKWRPDRQIFLPPPSKHTHTYIQTDTHTHTLRHICFPSKLSSPSFLLLRFQSYLLGTYLAASSLFSLLSLFLFFSFIISSPLTHCHFLTSFVSLWLSFQLGEVVSLRQRLKEVRLRPRNPPPFSSQFFFFRPPCQKRQLSELSFSLPRHSNPCITSSNPSCEFKNTQFILRHQ